MIFSFPIVFFRVYEVFTVNFAIMFKVLAIVIVCVSHSFEGLIQLVDLCYYESKHFFLIKNDFVNQPNKFFSEQVAKKIKFY